MTKEFDYTKLTFEDRESIHNALAETTLKHIDASDGLFNQNPFNPAANPSQLLETVHLQPVPVRREEVSELANIASPNLFALIKSGLGKQRAFTSAARTLLAEGNHIFPVTNHGNIADVAIWYAAFSDHLEQDHWQDQDGIVISRGVTTIGAFGMAASEVVEKAGHVFMSFPRTETIETLGFDKELINTNNKNMRKEIHNWLGEDLRHKILRNRIGRVLNMAWSGKTDRITYGSNHNLETITMGGVSGGTIDIVKRGLVLPMVLWDGPEPIFELGELTKVVSHADTKRIQRWQGDTLATALGIPKDNVRLTN